MINKVWKDIDWTKVELDVYNLQKEIFIFSAKENLLQNKIETRKLQKLLVEKEESKLLAIRKITQDSRKKLRQVLMILKLSHKQKELSCYQNYN